MNLKRYLRQFEADVIVAGVVAGKLGDKKMVPLKAGKLSKQPFGRTLGEIILTEESLAVDYYGHIKKSRGLILLAREVQRRQVKMIEAKVVHFANIKIEKVADLAPELVSKFPHFKGELLKLRGFAGTRRKSK